VLTVTHKPVLLKETIEALAVQPGGRYIDCTLGGGGHALAILEASAPGGQLLGIDADPEAIRTVSERLISYHDSAFFVNDNFANLAAICKKYDFSPVHGIIFDLGMSSFQLDDDPRGFSFQYDAALDMRFGPQQGTTAADIINNSTEIELAQILKEYGEEPFARRIARRIFEARPIKTTLQLAAIVEDAVGGRHGRIHPATRTFQALRIAVNCELENLEAGLQQAVTALGPGGRLVIIAYHSLEDRIVKHFLQDEAKDCICPPSVPVCQCGHKATLHIITKKILVPSFEETSSNPRSRSAKMRVAEKLGGTPMAGISPNARFSRN
jgi:16S rRNA (cytosine1402-N4)-methyltransferase